MQLGKGNRRACPLARPLEYGQEVALHQTSDRYDGVYRGGARNFNLICV